MTVIRVLIVLFLTSSFESAGQTVLRIVDSENGNPVPDAMVQYGWQFDGVAVSDNSGMVKIVGQRNKLPIQISHLNYEVYSDTIHAQTADIFLDPLASEPLVQLDLQSETVGREYSFIDQGIHNYGLRFSIPLKQRFNFGAYTRMNRFGGWQGEAEGRERAWHPKDQFFYGGAMSYHTDQFKLNYQYNKLNETIYNPSDNIITPSFRDSYVIEEEYISKRDFHQLHFDYDLNNWFWQFAASYTDFQRRTREFSTNMVTNSETDIASGADTVSYQSFFGRNTASFSGFKDLTIQLGADVNYEVADGSRLQDGTQPQWNVGLFAGTEWELNDRLLLRPGIRFTYNPVFNTVPTPAFNARYQLKQTTFRLGWGMGYRAPSPRELYHEFIDSNHNIIGNEKLTPEYSQNVNFQITQNIYDKLSLEGRFFYNTIRDRIGLVQRQSGTNPGFTYANIRDWTNHGLNLETSFDHNNWSSTVGFSYIGIAQNLETDNAEVPEYVYSPELIARMNWSPGSNSFSVFYKYTGPNQQYRINDEGEAVLGGIEGFHWMDITWQRHWTSFLSSTIGIKNVFDVTALNNSGGTGGVHGGGDTLVQGYGTSVFAKIQLKFINHK
jgi:outer membrane receptor for ferrienterochelin and colicins